MTAATPGRITLRLPATSANLGPAFDAAGLAMALTLTIEAEARPGVAEPLSIEAAGRNADRVSRTSNNMIFEAYRSVLERAGKAVLPLHLRIVNEIPLGMGCGSSAAALLGGVLLANHFGGLGWSQHACMEDACRREGHPDNVAACALGYMTVSAEAGNHKVVAATFGEQLRWKLLLALPLASLSTERARAMLPASYSRADAVANVQRASLLVAAFALGRGDLLSVASHDRLHQPYRLQACPLLAQLLSLEGSDGVLSVTLSGAGPGVLVIAAENADARGVAARIRDAAKDPGLEVVESRICGGVVSAVA